MNTHPLLDAARDAHHHDTDACSNVTFDNDELRRHVNQHPACAEHLYGTRPDATDAVAWVAWATHTRVTDTHFEQWARHTYDATAALVAAKELHSQWQHSRCGAILVHRTDQLPYGTAGQRLCQHREIAATILDHSTNPDWRLGAALGYQRNDRHLHLDNPEPGTDAWHLEAAAITELAHHGDTGEARLDELTDPAHGLRQLRARVNAQHILNHTRPHTRIADSGYAAALLLPCADTHGPSAITHLERCAAEPHDTLAELVYETGTNDCVEPADLLEWAARHRLERVAMSGLLTRVTYGAATAAILERATSDVVADLIASSAPPQRDTLAQLWVTDVDAGRAQRCAAALDAGADIGVVAHVPLGELDGTVGEAAGVWLSAQLGHNAAAWGKLEQALTTSEDTDTVGDIAARCMILELDA